MSNKLTFATIALLVLLSAAVYGCGSTPDPLLEPREPLDLVVLHTNDNWGETDPCG